MDELERDGLQWVSHDTLNISREISYSHKIVTNKQIHQAIGSKRVVLRFTISGLLVSLNQ